MYLSIDIEPHRVDVNVHPTKREVNFLHEDEIIKLITEKISELLATVDTSRSFLTQTLIPGVGSKHQIRSDNDAQAGGGVGDNAARGSTSRATQITRKPNENSLNRVDTKVQKITTLLKQQNSARTEIDDETVSLEPKEWQEYNYVTLRRLRADVRESMHDGLCEIFRDHTFVGIVDEPRRLAAIQHGVKLYLVDYAAVWYGTFLYVDTKGPIVSLSYD